MRRVIIGLLGGIAGGAVNLLFLLFAPDLDLAVYLSTGATWIAIGILISLCALPANGIARGICVAALVSAPSLIYTFVSAPGGALWTLGSTLIFGAALGYGIARALSRLEGGRRAP